MRPEGLDFGMVVEVGVLRSGKDDGCWLKPIEFKAKYGMDRESFWKLHGMISSYDGFSKRESRGRKQIASQE